MSRSSGSPALRSSMRAFRVTVSSRTPPSGRTSWSTTAAGRPTTLRTGSPGRTASSCVRRPLSLAVNQISPFGCQASPTTIEDLTGHVGLLARQHHHGYVAAIVTADGGVLDKGDARSVGSDTWRFNPVRRVVHVPTETQRQRPGAKRTRASCCPSGPQLALPTSSTPARGARRRCTRASVPRSEKLNLPLRSSVVPPPPCWRRPRPARRRRAAAPRCRPRVR